MNRKDIKDFTIDNKGNIISLAVFGSYNTESFIENRSDIDVLNLFYKR